MTTSDRAYAWAWLPGTAEPVVAGAVDRLSDGRFGFTYARSYLEKPGAIALGPDLLLQPGTTPPSGDLPLHGTLRDSTPDLWGRRVILDALTGSRGQDAETADLDEIQYMLNSGSDRIGALDFQESPTRYVHRGTAATLDELHNAADLVQQGTALEPGLEAALLYGTSIGGARPKALVTDPQSGKGWIAKFSSTADPRPNIEQEAASMFMAARMGLRVPEVQVVESLGKRVLLVERFDRPAAGGRRMMVSALSLSGVIDMAARHLTYPDLVRSISELSAKPGDVGPELFRRIAFNIAISNTDDHARNHAVFWDGQHAELTPAYDLDPQSRTGETANQAMYLDREGSKSSDLGVLLAAHKHYGVTRPEAEEFINWMVRQIIASFGEAADFAGLSADQGRAMWRRQILNPGSLHRYNDTVGGVHVPSEAPAR